MASDNSVAESFPLPNRGAKTMRCLLAVTILLSVVGCDQATKKVATERLRGAGVQTFLKDTLRFEYTLNAGGFLSLGSTLSPRVRTSLFICFNTCLMIGLTFLLVLRWRMQRGVFIALLCVLAGGVGNLIDRMTHDGLVVDFMNVGLGTLRTGIFNVADMGITFGTIALVLLSSFPGDRNALGTVINRCPSEETGPS